VVHSLLDLVGGDCPVNEDVLDLFNLLDVNGDGSIDKREFSKVLTTFFKLLKEQEIEIDIGEETDIVI
jgi:Ca2+-binding EF-hand superfamily protein